MSWVGVAIGGGAVVGAIINSNASGNAASAQAGAANNATAVQQGEFNTIQGETQPYRDVGTQNVKNLNSQIGALTTPFNPQNLQNTPGYQFQLQQGQQAIARSSAARGLLNSTGTMQGLDSYSQGLADTTYQQALSNYNNQNQQTYSMLAGMSNLGLAGTGQSVSAGMNFANQAGSNMIQAGNAQAAGMVGQANAVTNGMSGLAQAGAMYGMSNPSTANQDWYTPQTNTYAGYYDPQNYQ